MGNVRADNDLVLASGVDDLKDAFGFLDSVGVGLGVVLEGEAKTGCAVDNAFDVGCASDVLEDGCCEFFVVHKNGTPFFMYMRQAWPVIDVLMNNSASSFVRSVTFLPCPKA